MLEGFSRVGNPVFRLLASLPEQGTLGIPSHFHADSCHSIHVPSDEA
jgi:hypothetical protein